MREIPGFPGYKISIIAEVWSFRGKRPRRLKPFSDGKYVRVTLRRDGKSICRTVHSLMAETYIGPRPEGMEVRHLDTNGLNNVSTNIVYRPCGRR